MCRVHEGLFLAAALEFSTRRKESVTSSWFIGGTAFWPYCPRDVGAFAYRRSVQLMTLEERERVCGPEEVVAEGVSDYWWNGLDEDSAQRIADAIRISAAQFLTRAPVVAVRRSRYWAHRKALVSSVCEKVNARLGLDDWRRDGLPHAWRDAAQVVVDGDGGNQPAAPTQELAEDAALCQALGLV